MSLSPQPEATPPLHDRRQDVRVVLSLPGRYRLPKRRAAHGRPPEFACRLVNMSPQGLVLAGPVIGAIGEAVEVYAEEFGQLRGAVLRTLYGGFAMSIIADAPRRAQLESKLLWLEKHQCDDLPNARRHKRIVPQSPHSTLILADGGTLPCFVIDMSASGAAVSADIQPPLGTPLAVGRIVGRVVRQFAEGFAVHFVAEQDSRFVEQLLIKPFVGTPSAAALATAAALSAQAAAQAAVRAPDPDLDQPAPEGFSLGDIIAIDA